MFIYSSRYHLRISTPYFWAPLKTPCLRFQVTLSRLSDSLESRVTGTSNRLQWWYSDTKWNPRRPLDHIIPAPQSNKANLQHKILISLSKKFPYPKNAHISLKFIKNTKVVCLCQQRLRIDLSNNFYGKVLRCTAFLSLAMEGRNR